MEQNILVIDDDEGIRTVFTRFLERKGYLVSCASNGREGLNLLDSVNPDLVITDIMMPEADGLEVLMAVRARPVKIPVIAISGGMHAVPMDFLPLAKKFGAEKVLYKPVELEDLLSAVEEVLVAAKG